KEKELVNLHSTIEAAYDKYRSDLVMSGGSASKEIKFEENMDPDVFNKYFADFTYSGNHLTKANLSGSVFSLKIKGDLLKDEYKTSYQEYIKEQETTEDLEDQDNSGEILEKTEEQKLEERYIEDGICLVGSKIIDVTDEDSTETKEIAKNCKKNGDSPIPSQEEMLCIKLVVNDEELINDFDKDKSMQPLCQVFGLEK
ncbi:MAG: hypothetical protein ACI4PE_02340, partial [Bacilli bacterium]